MTIEMIQAKMEARSRARILLVSDSYEEEKILRTYFANVTVIKSLAVAKKYFEKHPEELQLFDVIEVSSNPFLKDRFTIGYSSFGAFLKNHLKNYVYVSNVTSSGNREFQHIIDFDFFNIRSNIPKNLSPEERTVYYLEGINAIYESLAYAKLFQGDNCFWLNHGPVDISNVGVDYKESREIPSSENETRVLLLGPKSEYFSSFRNEEDEKDDTPSNELIKYYANSHVSFSDDAIDVLGEFDIIVSTSTDIQHLANEVYMQNLAEGRKASLLINYNEKDNTLQYTTVGNIGAAPEISDAPATARTNVDDLIKAVRVLYKENIMDKRETFDPPKYSDKKVLINQE